MKRAIVHVRMSQSMEEYMAASLDLLVAVKHADPALVTDEILEAAQRLAEVIERHKGDL